MSVFACTADTGMRALKVPRRTSPIDASIHASRITIDSCISGVGFELATVYVASIAVDKMVFPVCLAPSSLQTSTAHIKARSLNIRNNSVKRTRPGATTCSITTDAPIQMKVYKASELSNQELQKVTARPRIDFSSILGIVSGHVPIITLADSFTLRRNLPLSLISGIAHC